MIVRYIECFFMDKQLQNSRSFPTCFQNFPEKEPLAGKTFMRKINFTDMSLSDLPMRNF